MLRPRAVGPVPPARRSAPHATTLLPLTLLLSHAAACDDERATEPDVLALDDVSTRTAAAALTATGQTCIATDDLIAH